ncbi:MAG: type II toxin-antitoxin system PemK/MazF family toxin [Alcaligenaceae bacterium]|nr:type II toxin-antitoxin system PemK/MazF family toxin [Alcaligenaceae bacterium]
MSTRKTTRRYVPDCGDIVHIHFAAPLGSAVGPHKAALIVSPKSYNDKTGLMVCCAITEHVKGYPFEVPLDAGGGQVALADQPKSLNWSDTRITLEGKATPDELAQTRAKLRALLFHE